MKGKFTVAHIMASQVKSVSGINSKFLQMRDLAGYTLLSYGAGLFLANLGLLMSNIASYIGVVSGANSTNCRVFGGFGGFWCAFGGFKRTEIMYTNTIIAQLKSTSFLFWIATLISDGEIVRNEYRGFYVATGIVQRRDVSILYFVIHTIYINRTLFVTERDIRPHRTVARLTVAVTT